MFASTLKRLITGAAILGVSMGAAQAASFFVQQETAAGSGVFATLGTIEAYDISTLTALQAYQFGNPDAWSYNGDQVGLPAAQNNSAMLFLAETSEGLNLFMVLDAAGGGGNGRAGLTWTATGDMVSPVFTDDGSEAPSVAGSTYTYNFAWSNCCTDGLVLGTLDGDWGLEGEFLNSTGLSTFFAASAGGPNIALSLADGQAVRLSAVPIPAALPLMGAAFAGLMGSAARRRRS